MSKTVALLFVLILLSSLAVAGMQLVNLVTANFIVYLPYIVIKSDGSIEPETEFIKRNGIVYSLADDISREYAIKIQCNNIIFNGAGHTISGSIPSGLGYSNKGLILEGVTNVTVKDLKVEGFINRDISIENSSECVILRVKAQIFHLWGSDYNIISESNIGSSYLYMNDSNNNTIMRNNISLSDIDFCNSNILFANNIERIGWHIDEANFWDNGSIGNYWNNYFGEDTNGDGIGDTPFTINPNNIDHYPLMAPVDVTTTIPEFPSWIILPLFLVATMVVILYRNRLRRKVC